VIGRRLVPGECFSQPIVFFLENQLGVTVCMLYFTNGVGPNVTKTSLYRLKVTRTRHNEFNNAVFIANIVQQ